MQQWRKLVFFLSPPLLALAVLISVQFKTDLSAFIIAGDNAEELLLAAEMQSGALSRRYLLSVGSGGDASVPDDFIRAFRNRLTEIAGVSDVWTPGQQSDLTQTLQTLYGRYGSTLFGLEAEPQLAELFTPKGLGNRARFLKQALLSPQGPVLKKIALHDPLLLAVNGFQAVSGSMQQVAGNDGRFRNLILETAMAGLDAAQQGRIQSEIHKIFDSLKPPEQGTMRLEMTGVPVFAVATQKLIQSDITRISFLSSIMLVGLFLLLFRSFGSLFQVFTLLIIVVLSAILATQSVFGYVHGMTVAIGSTLIGICIDYPIHAVAHAQSVTAERKATVIAKIWPSMLLGGITTLVGYIALGASGYPGFRQVAVYAGTGIITALALTRLVLPGLIAANVSQPLNVPWVSGWLVVCRRFRPWLIALLLSALGASMFGLKSLHWLKDMQELTPELNYLKENDKRIRARMVSIEPGRFILVTGENTEAALQNGEQVYGVLERLKRQGVLTDYFGLYPWLLSAQRQRRNQLSLQRYLTPENQVLWQQALGKQGLSVQRLSRLDYPGIAPLTPEQVLASPVKRLIDSRIVTTGHQTMVMIWLGAHRPEPLKAAFAGMANVRYFSQRDLLNNMTRDYTDRAKILLSAGLIVIFLLLVGRYRSLVKGVQTLLPAMLAAVVIIGVWSYSGAAISFLHLVGFLLVVAICVDYGIFYQENRGGHLNLTYQAMAASMLTSALAFGCLGAADSASLRILAGVVALGVLLGFLLCPLIIDHRRLE